MCHYFKHKMCKKEAEGLKDNLWLNEQQIYYLYSLAKI